MTSMPGIHDIHFPNKRGNVFIKYESIMKIVFMGNLHIFL